jgi:hypothetical protein
MRKEAIEWDTVERGGDDERGVHECVFVIPQETGPFMRSDYEWK